MLVHSHKKQKDILKGSLVRALFAAQLEFPKILIPSLPQNTSNVSTESTGKTKQLYDLYDQLLGALIYLHLTVLILICFELIMSVVNYAINGCSYLRTTPGA